MKKQLLSILLCSVLGCASAEKKACQTQDWFEFGKSQALEGTSPESSPFLKTCQREGVAPDAGRMGAGYQAGLKDFCQPMQFERSAESGEVKTSSGCPAGVRAALEESKARGLKKHCTQAGAYDRGKSGKPNGKVCPEKFQKNYDESYTRGRIFYAKAEVLRLERRKTEISRRQKEINEEIPKLEALKKRYDELDQKNKRNVLESLEKVSMNDPQNDLNGLVSEKERLREELNQGTLRKEDLEAEIARMELEVSEARPTEALKEGR